MVIAHVAVAGPDVGVAAKLEIELEPFDDRAQALLLEPSALANQPSCRRHPAERLSAPDTQRVLDPVTSDL